MNEGIIIKKYQNRRLYNTKDRCYINLGDIEKLVKDDIPFKVIDGESGKDITKVILYQVILENMKDYEPIFPSEFLRQIIKHRNIAINQRFQSFLSQIFEYFNKFEEEWISHQKKFDFSSIFNPFNLFSKFTKSEDVDSLKDEISRLKNKISTLEEEILKNKF